MASVRRSCTAPPSASLPVRIAAAADDGGDAETPACTEVRGATLALWLCEARETNSHRMRELCVRGMRRGRLDRRRRRGFAVGVGVAGSWQSRARVSVIPEACPDKEEQWEGEEQRYGDDERS